MRVPLVLSALAALALAETRFELGAGSIQVESSTGSKSYSHTCVPSRR